MNVMRAPSASCLQALRAIVFSIPSRPCHAPTRRYASTSPKQPPPPSSPSPPKPPAPLRMSAANAQPGFLKRNRSDDDEDFEPLPLSRPIGMPDPPQPGENMGLDTRSLVQKRNDFVDYDKHLERRARMTKQISKPYFRDWSNLRFHRGKIFRSNERLFSADASLWFPNFYGPTLRADEQARDLHRGDGYRGRGRDTCDAMRGKVSVVSIVSNMWAQAQIDSFCSPRQNPELRRALREGADVAQTVFINYESNTLKWWLLQLFRYNLRAGMTPDEQSRYFMVRRGVSEVMREALGMLNDKVGYVYLVDPECRIRWAGSADAEPQERESMVRGLRRLVQEARSPADPRGDSRQQLEQALADITEAPSAATTAG